MMDTFGTNHFVLYREVGPPFKSNREGNTIRVFAHYRSFYCTILYTISRHSPKNKQIHWLQESGACLETTLHFSKLLLLLFCTSTTTSFNCVLYQQPFQVTQHFGEIALSVNHNDPRVIWKSVVSGAKPHGVRTRQLVNPSRALLLHPVSIQRTCC